jgi:hypothetical protein
MTSFDWLSDLQPLFDAQKSWLEGSYDKPTTAQLVCSTAKPFCIACGAGLLAEHIRRFKFGPPIIQRLGQVTNRLGRSLFQESFLNHLQRIRLRAQVNAAPEGTLLLPEEPILTIQAPELQVLLLDSAIRLLIWESTNWATNAALEQWNNGVFSESETPPPGNYSFNQTGWKMRAKYIGGSMAIESPESFASADEWPGLTNLEHSPGHSLIQIRRLFKGEQPLADVWLTALQDKRASVSHTHIAFLDEPSGKTTEVQMSRFQNLMQPLLVKGHPALNTPSLDYLRQRSWKQLEVFHGLNLDTYQRGWVL